MRGSPRPGAAPYPTHPMTPPAGAASPSSYLERRTALVVSVVTLAAYLPLLFTPEFYRLSLGQMVLIVGLGLLYLALATFGFGWYDRQPTPGRVLLYFGSQTLLVTLILYQGLDYGGALWLLLLPVAAQSVGRPYWVTAFICLALFAGLMLVFWLDGYPPEAITQYLLGIGAAMVFTLVFTGVAVREQSIREEAGRLAVELREANQKLREYAVRVEDLATMEERNRLAREIHDSLGHYLTVINVQLGAAQAVLDQDPERARLAVSQAQRLTQEGLDAVRQSVAALREAPLSNRSLVEAVRGLLDEVRTSGVVTQMVVHGQPRPAGPKEELTLFRAAQEGLTNVRKHARASQVTLTLDYETPGRVVVTVQDNGIGAAQAEGGFGLLGLRERVQLLGGDIYIDTAPGRGLFLSVAVPG